MEEGGHHNEESRSISPGKSLSVSQILESQNSADLPINQVDENHYVYRKGSTQVHVQTYPASSVSDIINETKRKTSILKGIQLFSALFALIMVVITLVIKLTAAITDQISDTREDEYMLALYAVGFVWITYYHLRGVCKYQSQVKFLKSNQSSNRWLKGVIILFGLAIVLKSGLEFLTFVTANISNCVSNQVEASRVFFHGLFVISQVTYLIRFSKVYIWNFSTGSRVGLMYIISVNLSTWIAGIVDETLVALEDGSTSVEDVVLSTSMSYDTNKTSYEAGESSYGEEECECHSTFCNTVHVAETFLFPFVIEFSLVASCMLYFTWSNIGKHPLPCEKVIKPSYKFYGKYAGASLGGVAFFLTVVFLILLGTSGTSTTDAEEGFFTKDVQLLLYDGFLMSFETIMLLVTLVGFYFFYKITRPLEKSPMLDGVLLVVCLLGPLTEKIFSMIAVVLGADDRALTWIFTFLHPLVDVLQCLLQLMFIMYGLKREPVTSTDAKETEAQLRLGMKEQSRDFDQSGETSSENGGGHVNMTYLRSRQNSITSIVSRLANVQSNTTAELYTQALPSVENGDAFAKDKNGEDIAMKNEITSFTNPAILVSEPKDETINFNDDITKLEIPDKSSDFPNEKERPPKHNILKIVSEVKVARPDKLRSWLRDVIFFLLVANASLWMFQSLSGTAFTVEQFESIFYGASAWTTITMICRPLVIFFRMHSAGCLFEMWSFA